MPPGRHPTLQRTPLERKLELLEARFSQDPVGSTGGGTNSQHSFSFDGGTTTSLLSHPTLAGGCGNSQGFDRVQKAAERHLHKVQQKVVVWASDASNNNSGSAVTMVHHNNRVVPATPESQKGDAAKEMTSTLTETSQPVLIDIVFSRRPHPSNHNKNNSHNSRTQVSKNENRCPSNVTNLPSRKMFPTPLPNPKLAT
eukprot:scaffold1294_cov167-Amphora_coffeaeformis.AAC.28